MPGAGNHDASAGYGVGMDSVNPNDINCPVGLAKRPSDSPGKPLSPLSSTRRRQAEALLSSRLSHIYPVRVPRRLLWWYALAGIWKAGLMLCVLSEVGILWTGNALALRLLSTSIGAVAAGALLRILAIAVVQLQAKRDLGSSISEADAMRRQAVVCVVRRPKRRFPSRPEFRIFVWPALVWREALVIGITLAVTIAVSVIVT